MLKSCHTCGHVTSIPPVRVNTLEEIRNQLKPGVVLECESQLERLIIDANQSQPVQTYAGFQIRNYSLQYFNHDSDVYETFSDLEQQFPGYHVKFNDMDGIWYPKLTLE